MGDKDFHELLPPFFLRLRFPLFFLSDHGIPLRLQRFDFPVQLADRAFRFLFHFITLLLYGLCLHAGTVGFLFFRHEGLSVCFPVTRFIKAELSV